MSIKIKAQQAVNNLQKVNAEPWTDQQQAAAIKVIEVAMIDAVNEFCESSSKAVNQCCSPDQDMAHKINDEIQRAKQAVIANLSSLR